MIELTEIELLAIQNEALKFTQNKISTDGMTNWDTIYDLKREVLKLKKEIEKLKQKQK